MSRDSKGQRSEESSDEQQRLASEKHNDTPEQQSSDKFSNITRRGALSVLGGAALLGATGNVSAKSGQKNRGKGHPGKGHPGKGHPGKGHQGGKSIRTEPPNPPYARAKSAGFDIQNIVPVTKTSEITGAANTLYVVDGDNGPLTWDGPIELERVDDTAICGKNGASLKIPAGYRSYAVWMVREDDYSEGGTGFLWSGIDIDQTAEGAYGRIDAHVNDKAVIEYVKTIGRGRPANPDPSSPLDGIGSGPALFPAAANPDGTNIVRNVELIHGGVYASQHYGDRPSGIFMASRHQGTLHIQNTRIEEFPNNALYASNVPGTVIAKNCRFYNNGVTNGRISHGKFVNCTIGFDYKNTGMANANAPEHGLVGIAVEQKKSGVTNGPYPSIYGCTIEMKNVAKSGGGIRTYDIYRPAHIGEISGCDIHIGNTNATHDFPSAPDIDIPGICDSISNTVMSGSADSGTSIINQGPSIAVHNLSFDYPAGREKKTGEFHHERGGSGRGPPPR